jgi:uncharacterized protein
MSNALPTDLPPRPTRLPWVSDEVAYVLPMGVFLAFVWAQGHWPSFYPLGYLLKTVVTATLLIMLWPLYTRIHWNGWWLGLILGVIGTVQWIGMQLWLERHVKFLKSSGGFIPPDYFHTHASLYGFFAVRLIGAVCVVPFMEERFWRDYLWRQIIAPNDFKLANIGEWSPAALFIVSLIFSTVHANWCLTAIVWGLMIGLLLIKTKSLGACIICHATTNLLMGLWVIKSHTWSFW